MKNASENKINILIVDDMPRNIQAASAILIREGYRLAYDEDGESALAHVKTMNFNLILLDIMMPGIDGYEVCRRLKADPETHHIPVIFLTGRTDTESIVKGFNLGAADYVGKPFNPHELLARVRTHLELNRHRDHLEHLVLERTEALRVMMQVREEISAKHEEKIEANIVSRIFPMIEMLRGIMDKPRQKECLNTVESALNEILSEFSRSLASPRFNLTPMELQIAGLIREGRSGKQIADLIGTSENTFNFHRQNIRKKLGLSNVKTSLKSFLQSME
jgi:DNA-binding response OmpR family regulator/DNA-binding CsgD family transcriptional regulator